MASAEQFDIHHLKQQLIAAGDSEVAPGMKAYMKHNFGFLGLKSPYRKEIQKPFIKDWSQGKTPIRWDMVEALWQLPEREYQYVALDYLHRVIRKLQPGDIVKLEKLVVTKSWWDSVDALSKPIGHYFKLNPHEMQHYLNRWESSGNMWLLRTAILFQLSYGKDTDYDLLEELVSRHKSNKEFFIRKAIGWALRQYSKHNPIWVEACCERQALQGLSLREALKDIQRKR